MLVKLSARGLRPLGPQSAAPFIVRVVDDMTPSTSSAEHDALLLRNPDASTPPGFRAYLFGHQTPDASQRDAYVLGAEHAYVGAGDVVRIDPRRRSLTALYRATSPFTTFLVTERCDNYCTMCSQPPKPHDDSWLGDDLERAIPLIPPDAAEIGISGGEPALLGDRLIRLLRSLRDHLPRTAVHVLSNGRRFADPAFARAVADVRHPDLMLGIPLYADLPELHDYVVQANGAFNETVRGILNLKRARARVEVRFVIHRDTFERLPDFARFLARNLTFVDHVALMGLELIGFARSNVETLWVDPLDYQRQLASAVTTLDRAGMAVSIFNHQLCALDRRLWSFARKSVSDWKNLYFDECAGCAQRDACGGFFASSTLRRSRGIHTLVIDDRERSQTASASKPAGTYSPEREVATSAAVPDKRRDEPWSLPKAMRRSVNGNAQLWKAMTGHVLQFDAALDGLRRPPRSPMRRAKESGYTGNKTAFYALVAGARPPRATPIMRFEGLPGEFSQHDFGHVDVTFVDGRKKRIHFFASRLESSRFVAVSIVEDERVETLVRGLARHFVAFGGLPLLSVFDRPRTIVTKSGKGRAVETFNATFAQAIIDIGVEVSAPRSGNQKGAVERLVGWVKGSFFKPRKFQDERDLEAQLPAWLVEANTKTPSRATGVIPETKRQEELPRLRPVKVFPETLALRFPIVVGPTAEVHVEGVPYSMPPDATHVAGTLFLHEKKLTIVAGRFTATHRRRTKDEPSMPLPEHRAAKIAAVHGKRAKLYEKRQQLLNLGAAALALLTEITHREPKLSSRRVEELYASLEEYGDEAMREALTETVTEGALSVAAVRRALSARRCAGERPRGGAAQPRGEELGPLALPFGRAELGGLES